MEKKDGRWPMARIPRMEVRMIEKERNEKLARWAGFELVNWLHNKWAIFPDGTQGNTPDFTTNLNACVKWLVPELRKVRELPFGQLQRIAFIYDVGVDGDEILCRLYGVAETYRGQANTGIEALVMAIEEVIDNE